MPRISFTAFAQDAAAPNFNSAMFCRISNGPLPKGVTLNRAVEHWMKANCTGDWTTKKVNAKSVMAVFFDPADYAKASANFAPNTPWRSPHPSDLGGFLFA